MKSKIYIGDLELYGNGKTILRHINLGEGSIRTLFSMNHALPLIENGKTNQTLTPHPEFLLLCLGRHWFQKALQGQAAHWMKHWSGHTHSKPLSLVPLILAAATG